MKRLAYLLLAASVLFLTSCGLLATGAGVNEYTDKDGIKRVHVDTNSPADKAQHLLETLGPWGVVAGAGIALATKVIRHREILAHGQKDDNDNGIPDEDEKAAEAPKV